ncbi:terminase small subunit [Limosilactobacillus sp.]|jgi:phage terminase small subunit|uniref:terminase small subunit n=1 Tax=Limosilactobacillus sp. TaxID=2773925 RepID=UPI0025C41FA3|nr:terminase small subunit [Limosilactobacillus sp.]MCH3922374.1 terminase small subunit [Limosilactobacillus sp.]MCH3929146.1 terminase small subunit [Limosilactobacillus sp.]
MRLTAKQRLFADEYIKSGNATQSAIKAGYSPRTVRSIGQENLTKPDIKAYIDAKMAEIESHKIADAKEVLQFYTRVLRKEETEPEKLMDDDGSEHFYEREPSLKDRLTAAKELMKRYPLSDPLVKEQLRKIRAEAELTEHKSKLFEGGQGNLTKIVFSDDLKPDVEDDTDQKGDESDGTDTKPE